MSRFALFLFGILLPLGMLVPDIYWAPGYPAAYVNDAVSLFPSKR